MKPCLLPALLLPNLLFLAALPANASASLPASPAPPAVNTLQMEPEERRFFTLGLTLARGAFAYAELAKGATEVQKTRSKIAQVGKLGKLAPVAARNRRAAGEKVAQAADLMRVMEAPSDALGTVTKAAVRLAGTLPITSDAKPLLIFNRDAARTLSALNEFELLSSLPEDAAIRHWLETPTLARSASVWYGEGEIAGLAQIAAAQEMPELLPSAQQLATDLRGLRDWLSLRLPDTPSPEQAALKNALESFLRETAATERVGVRSHKALTPAQLQALGEISRQLEAQVGGT
jgi:ribosomal protein L10